MKDNGDINVDVVPQYASFLCKNDIRESMSMELLVKAYYP